MKTLVPVIALLLTGCATQQQSSQVRPETRQLSNVEMPSKKPVTVTDCHGKLAAIYADSNLTTPMANPVWPDSDGRINFWTARNVCVPREF